MKVYEKPVVSVDAGMAEGEISIVLQYIIHMKQKNIPIQHRQLLLS